MAYPIVRARVYWLPNIGARDHRIISGGCIEGITPEIFVRTNKGAAVLTSTDRRSTGGRKQRQDGYDHGSRENHCERYGEDEVLQVKDCAGEVVRRR